MTADLSPLPNVRTPIIPEPTLQYRRRRKLLRATVGAGEPRLKSPAANVPAHPNGSRALIYKQDPSVAEIGVRKVFLPNVILAGPRDARIQISGVPAVSPNAMGDYILQPGTTAFDAVHTFAVVRATLTLFQRALGGAAIPWQWNTAKDAEPLSVHPVAGETANAFYSRRERALKFFYFRPHDQPPDAPLVLTCRSLDIVAHETGHAVLDAMKPGWLSINNVPQTGGLHESFGDLAAIFLALSQLDQVEAVIAQTKSKLHEKTFLADLAEQFGLALGRPNGLRNADNDLTLSEVGTEVHAISQVFTGAVYDILADIFEHERRPSLYDDAVVLHDVASYVLSLVVRAIQKAPPAAATFADVANQMLALAAADGKPVEYRNFIRNQFALREVVVSPTPLSEDILETKLEPAIQDDPHAIQDRGGCCGTMLLPEFTSDEIAYQAEIDELLASFGASGRSGGKRAR